MKITIEIENSLIKFFKDYIDDTEPVEVMIPKMLNLLRELIRQANKQH